MSSSNALLYLDYQLGYRCSQIPCITLPQAKKEELQQRLAYAEARNDLAAIADIKYGAMVDVGEQLQRLLASKPSHSILTEEVGPEEIGVVVSRWTGIPVARLQQVRPGRALLYVWCAPPVLD